MGKRKVEVLEPISNGAKALLEEGRPFEIVVAVQGVADLLMHGWNIEAVEEKSKARKGSTVKKTDNLESYVYRNEAGELCLPGDAIRAAMAEAGRFEQDPRSPRKSARDLVKTGLVPLTPLASLGVKDWEYVARHRVVVQRNAITRSRPALRTGWTCAFHLLVNVPEYLNVPFLQHLVNQAGRLQGLGDYRPTYGRFQVVEFKVVEYED